MARANRKRRAATKRRAKRAPVPVPVGGDGEMELPVLVVSRPRAAVPEAASSHAEAADALRLCVVDMGSNSFHALVVDAFPDGTFVVRARRKEMVKLGARGFNQHLLTEDAMARGLAALGRIRALAETWAVSAYLACATSAVREASNGGAFIERVRR
ncbi:MAG TPA: hypothetical protein VK610_04180, partial [Rhodothermales bacterium]|nr:hypothetical protein [Rhodothermales bacterium]